MQKAPNGRLFSFRMLRSARHHLVHFRRGLRTARIAHHLYGRAATIHSTRFEHLDLPEASFDLAAFRARLAQSRKRLEPP